MKIPDEILSTFRIFVAAVVGSLLAWLGSLAGIEVPAETGEFISGLVVAGLGAGYYLIARLVGRKTGFEYMLLVPKVPVLVEPKQADQVRASAHSIEMQAKKAERLP